MRKNYLLILLLLLFIPVAVYADEPILGDPATPKDNTTTIGAIDTNPSIIIDDQADLLTDEEEKKLYETMSLLSEYGKVVFLTVNTNPYGTADSYSRAYYTEKFSDNTDGVIFIIDMSTRYLYINSCGSLRTKLDSGKGRSITDNVFRYARNGQYFKCAQKAFEQAYTVVSGKQIFEPMRYISSVFIGLCSSAFLGFLIAYLGFRLKKATVAENMANNKNSFVIRDFNAIKTGTHMVYSPQSDGGGSSGGGGGGGGGGGFSGGGHSF